MVREWDRRVDEVILNKLSAVQKSHFNELFREIKIAKLPVTSRKLSKHLERLAFEHYIVRDNFAPGKKRFYRIHQDVKDQKNLDIFEGIQQKGKKQTRQRRNRNLMKLLFAVASTGSIRYHTKSKAEPGDIALYDKKAGKHTTYSLSIEKGVSVQDIIDTRIIGRRKHIDDYTREEIEKTIKKLRDKKIFKPVWVDGEIRFEFIDERVKGFVLHWNIIIDSIIRRMESYWKLLNKKPTTQEREWFDSIFDKYEKNNFFTGIETQRDIHRNTYIRFCKERFGQFYNPDLEKKLLKAAKKNDESHIRETDSGIKNQLKQLEEKYTDVKIKHRLIYDLMKETVYHAFLKIDSNHLTSGLSSPESIKD